MNSTINARKIEFRLDTASGYPFYRQIIQQIEHAVLSHRLLPGDRLPTIRSLAIELKINPNTIAKAYNELELRGIVKTQVGSGTYVSENHVAEEDSQRIAKIEERLVRFIQDMDALGVSRKELLELIRDFEEA